MKIHFTDDVNGEYILVKNISSAILNYMINRIDSFSDYKEWKGESDFMNIAFIHETPGYTELYVYIGGRSLKYLKITIPHIESYGK